MSTENGKLSEWFNMVLLEIINPSHFLNLFMWDFYASLNLTCLENHLNFFFLAKARTDTPQSNSARLTCKSGLADLAGSGAWCGGRFIQPQLSLHRELWYGLRQIFPTRASHRGLPAPHTAILFAGNGESGHFDDGRAAAAAYSQRWAGVALGVRRLRNRETLP